MQEWKSQWNPFNSVKILMFREWLEACAKGDYLSPPMVDIDPSNRCNFKCGFCNAWDMIHRKSNDLPTEHLIKLADFLAEWGVKSTCVSGGGEPMMNKGFNQLLLRLHENGIAIGPISNGSLMTDEHIEVISKTCRWIGFSIDASTNETYMKIKGIDNPKIFDIVLNNIKKLSTRIAKDQSKCDIGFKFLLTPTNAHEIYNAALLAKNVGAKDFHVRPACWDNIALKNNKESFKSCMDIVDAQMGYARELETPNFRVYGIRHKFNPDFTRKVNFKKCRAIPMLPTFGADGNVHTCFDMRGREDLIMCSHYPDPKAILKYWNSKEHKKQVDGIDPNTCPRCTFGVYNEVIEQVFMDDKMCRDFL